MEEYKIVEETKEKNCRTCGVNQKVNELGSCETSSKLVQAECLFCKFSKNAEFIEQTHKTLGIKRPLEDNWIPRYATQES